jgi:Cu-Zn family superoxide dismutase
MRANKAVAVMTVVLACAATAACSANSGGAAAPTKADLVREADATLAEAVASGEQPKGVTYDPRRVPVGARLAVRSRAVGGQSEVELVVTGLLPGTKYGSHVHTKPCGAKPADSGPHYQHEKDPVSPSVDPRYANVKNEVWLDFTTDANGAARASATVGWEFRPGEANAIVVHATHTRTDNGKAGTAGDRLACLTATF